VPTITQQQVWWNSWNQGRELKLSEVAAAQGEVIKTWLDGRSGLSILDVGCGAGWLVAQMLPHGRVVGTDLADEVVTRAQQRYPDAVFISGDFADLAFPASSFDVITTCEVLAHVADQQAFLAKISGLLKPGGELLLATQNRFVLERSRVQPPGEGQLRRWVNRPELRALLQPRFDILEMFTLTPRGDRGILRVANSVKLNIVADALLGRQRVTRMKERLGCGWTIMCRARRR
jgi:2-polyprenyl-3-methyl-5-hydroxy-6-metoxy-1,4-benzoquinol methylase